MKEKTELVAAGTAMAEAFLIFSWSQPVFMDGDGRRPPSL